MQTPLISVILPCSNSQKWIEEAINSVLAQSHTNIELIIIDDASSDKTISLINSLSDSRISLIKRSRCSGGPATPRNEGMKRAKGRYFAFIDSDDIWHPDKLKRQLAAIDKHQLNFVSSSLISFKDVKPPIPKLTSEDINLSFKNHEMLLRKNWVITSSALIEASLFKDIKFNHAKEYIGIEDYLAWLQIHQRDDIKSAVLKEPLVLYRLRSDSLSHSKYQMAKKVFHLLRTYQYRGRRLGLSGFYYFAYYALASLSNRFSKN